MKIRPLSADFFQADRWTYGRTDTPNEAKSLFSLTCECI